MMRTYLFLSVQDGVPISKLLINTSLMHRCLILKSLDSIQVFESQKFHKAASLFFRPTKRKIVVLPLEYQAVINVCSFKEACFFLKKEVYPLPIPT